MQHNDQPQREQALDPSQSFIVQAPAGSGKTSLLVQRYLTLLATVNYPEEIIAITFTRKAAAEMQDRIIKALNDAVATSAQDLDKIDPHDRKTIALAKQVLQQDTKQQWHLQICPNRLRLQTIDSLCLSLVNASPLAANIHTSQNIIQGEDANKYYLRTAQDLLNELDNDTFTYRNALEILLFALDNDLDRCLSLFVTMLQKREQWLPYIVGIRKNAQPELRLALEQSISNAVEEVINQCRYQFPSHLQQEIIDLANFAQSNLKEAQNAVSFLQPIDFKQLFFNIKSLDINSSLVIWQQFAQLFLTNEGSWRKNLDKRVGFPAASSATNKGDKALYQDMKQRGLALLEQLQNDTDLQHSLQEITYLPTPSYNEQQWQILCALVELLPLLAAQLDLTFREQQVVDYTAISLAAERAFGNPDSPSDLALHLDYRIKHILVDEFQDISQAQYRLLEKLTAGWENGDGRTLFFVGDPMQSIYRFRQAEVGLFLRSAQNGIGSIHLEPLQLTSNFRSTAPLVHWLNETFSQVLPSFADVALGCIPFSAAHSANNSSATQRLNQCNVKVQILVTKNAPDKSLNQTAEAQHVKNLVKEIRSTSPQDSIAILVSARHHLKLVLPELKAANIAFNAVEIENLNDSIVIQDLFALTRALTNVTDRVAWLAILRAPWCGLCLGDLYAIANAATTNTLLPTILENLNNYKQINSLSEDGKRRIAQLLPILQNSIDNRGRNNLRDWIERTWLALGGPATVQDPAHLEHAEQFWQVLETTATSAYTVDDELLAQKLAQLYTSQSDPAAQVQIMTIHKAKGLEFDHVIVCGLDRTTRNDDKQLLMWLERPRLRGNSDLLLAPIKEVGAAEDKIYSYLRHIEQQKDYYENGRLLYVACTRAKKTLYLIACASYNDSDQENSSTDTTIIKTPPDNSLLYQLWPCFKADWLYEIDSSSYAKITKSPQQTVTITRPAINWQYPFAEMLDNTTAVIDNKDVSY